MSRSASHVINKMEQFVAKSNYLTKRSFNQAVLNRARKWIGMILRRPVPHYM